MYREKAREEKEGERRPRERCVNRFSVFHGFHSRSEGEKGEVAFSLRRLAAALLPNNDMILSILVDTFISKISFPMQPGPEIGSISDA